MKIMQSDETFIADSDTYDGGQEIQDLTDLPGPGPCTEDALIKHLQDRYSRKKFLV